MGPKSRKIAQFSSRLSKIKVFITLNLLTQTTEMNIEYFFHPFSSYLFPGKVFIQYGLFIKRKIIFLIKKFGREFSKCENKTWFREEI